MSRARLPIPPHRQNSKAATGFEPVIKVLQTSALPLGYAAITRLVGIEPTMKESESFALPLGYSPIMNI